MFSIVIVMLIYHCHTLIDSINLLGSGGETKFASCEVQTNL
jgi:hypothetical protein